jgi:GAF domain-containing protein
MKILIYHAGKNRFMSTNSASNTIQAIAETISGAETSRAAAGALVSWFKRRAMIGLLNNRTASMDIILSPGYKPGETALRWMQSPETWLMWQTWEGPRRSGESVVIPECEEKALLIPLRYEGTLYGLLWLKTSRKYEESQAILLAHVLAARLHHLAVNSRWDTLLVSVNAFSRALSQESSSEDMWQTIHRQISDLFDTSSFYVGLLNPYTSQLTLPLYSENEAQIYYGPIRLSGLSRAVVQHGTPLLFYNVAAEKERLTALTVIFDADEPGRHAASWLGVPMRNQRGEVIGIVSIQNVLPNCYADPDLHLLMLIAGHIAHTIEGKRLLQDEQERRRVASTLMEVGQVVNSSLDQEEILERILEQIQHVVAYNSASILLPAADCTDGSRMVVSALNGSYPAAKGAELHLDKNSPGILVFQSQQPLVINDVHDYVGWNDSLPTGPRARSWLGVPMRIQNRVIGLITLDQSTPRYYSENDATTVFAMARQAAIAVENARLLVQSETQRQSLEQRARRLDSMQRIATIISSSLEHNTVLNMAAKFLTELFEVDHCGIVLIHSADGSASLVAEYPGTGSIGIKIPTQGNPIFEKMVQDSRPVAIQAAEEFDEVDD